MRSRGFKPGALRFFQVVPCECRDFPIQIIVEFGLLCFIQLKFVPAGENGIGRLFECAHARAPRIQFTTINKRS